MDREKLNKWEPMARAIPGDVQPLRAPVAILAGEALDVVRFCQRNWELVVPLRPRRCALRPRGARGAEPRRHRGVRGGLPRARHGGEAARDAAPWACPTIARSSRSSTSR